MSASLIIVAYQKPVLLERYVSSIRRFEDLSRLELILVDVAPNGLPDVRCDQYIGLGKASYAEAVNAGLRAASHDYLIWGNEDIKVSGPFVEQLLVPVVEEHRMIAGPNQRADLGWPFVVGWLVAMHRIALEEIGYLDEQFPGTFEDTDYGARCYKAGYRIERVEGLPVRHISLGRLNQHLMDCQEMFLNKHGMGPKA